MMRLNSKKGKSKYKSDKIAVVYAEGNIVYDADGYGSVSNGDYVKIF